VRDRRAVQEILQKRPQRRCDEDDEDDRSDAELAATAS
jgi:hypothetical protein